MKRIISGVLIISSIFNVGAQEAANKKVQAGLVFGYGMAFQKMETKFLQTNGIGSDLTIGANMNYGFTDNIGLNVGLEFDFESLKYKAAENIDLLYAYNDNKIIPRSDYNGSQSIFQLMERKQKPIYLTIPTMVLFRTKFIGYFRYFGKFGLKTSFLLGNKITDKGISEPSLTSTDIVENKNMSAKNEMFFMKSSVGLAGGAEWNFVGTTSLIAEIGYYYGFIPLYYNKKSEDRYLFSTLENVNNKAKQSQLMFKVSIMF